MDHLDKVEGTGSRAIQVNLQKRQDKHLNVAQFFVLLCYEDITKARSHTGHVAPKPHCGHHCSIITDQLFMDDAIWGDQVKNRSRILLN